MTKSRNLAKFPKTSAIQVPSGDTASRPSAANGYFRYNTTTSSFEGYSNGNWGAIGGSISAGGGLASWNVISSNYTVGNNIQLLANSAAGSFTITLPASPVLANVVVIADGSGPNTGWSNNNVLVDPNGKTIQGIADNLALNISRSSVSLIYDGATWQVISTTGPKGADGATGATGAAGVGANATQTNYRFNATNNQTIFVGADAYSQILSYNVNAVSVYLNGVYLRPTEDYVANNGTTIYLNSGTLANDALDVVSFQSMSLTAAQNTITTYVYTASNNQTSFGGADINGNILNYNTNNLFVTLNGLTLRNGVDYLQSNSSYIALTSGAAANDELNIVAFGSFQLPGTANTITNYSYTTTAGQTTISGVDTYGNTLSYNGGNLIVTRNGSTLRNRLDYTALNGTSITLANPAYANDEIGVITFTSFITSANTDYRYLSKIADDIVTGNVTFTANIIATGTGSFQVPQGTTAQRPAATSAGLIRFNTSLGTLETANGTAWSNVGSGSASSGAGYSANTTDTGYLAIPIGTSTQKPVNPPLGALRWNTSNNASEMYVGNNTWQIIASSTYTLEYLIVAGGGGGGTPTNVMGGGGAGGLLYGTTPTAMGTTYTVTVGAGGTVGGNGGNSSALNTSAIGGGKGGGEGQPGSSGGSGGGGSYTGSGGSGTSGQGYPGGNGGPVGNAHPCGGGGGAGGQGYSPVNNTSNGGPGGPGAQYSISGTATYYAGGGGGAAWVGSSAGGTGGVGGGGNGSYYPNNGATAGTSNSGGGGGGGWQSADSKPGGSGIVIIRYPGTQRGSGGSVTISGGYVTHTFTTSGTFIS